MVRQQWATRGFGSTLLDMLFRRLLPALPGSEQPGMPPGVLEMDDSSFWYSCSPTQGFECYFRPVRSCAQATGKVLPLCADDQMPAQMGRVDIGSPTWLQRGREALRMIWQYSEQTAAYLDSAAGAARRGAASPMALAPLITIHIRRGDAHADGREVTSMHAMAARVKRLAEVYRLPLKQVRVHVMSDDAKAANDFFHLLHLNTSARVAVPAIPEELASGFQTCLSPARFGFGLCNCSGPVPKNTSRAVGCRVENPMHACSDKQGDSGPVLVRAAADADAQPAVRPGARTKRPSLPR